MAKLWLLMFLFVQSTYSFSNTFVTELLGLGYSHGGITSKAIQQISFEYLNVTTEAQFIEKLKFGLYTKHVVAVELIEKFDDNVDNDPDTKNVPMYHFDAERFQRGNNLLITSQELILNLIRTGQYKMAREQLGKYLHPHQDFYSHSNWIEMGEKGAFKLLGEINAFNGNVATINMSTCTNCHKACQICDYECVDNIIPLLNQEKIFTSGYYVGEVEDGQPVPKPTNVLKCSHGSIIDTTSNIPALGGINKDMKGNLFSPHYYLQEKAANAAIQSTYLFLKKLWYLTETKSDNTSHFGRLLELVHDHQSLIFIIDLSYNMKNHLIKIKTFVRDVILHIKTIPSEIIVIAYEKQAYSIVIKPYIKNDIDRLFKFLDNLIIMGDRKSTMNAIMKGLSLANDHCFAYVFTDEINNYDNEVSAFAKRKNCQINFLLSSSTKPSEIIEQITFDTRGIHMNIQNENLSSIKQFISQSLNIKLIPILSVNRVLSNIYKFYIDSSVEMIQFVINTNFDSDFNIQNMFINPNHSAINILFNFNNPNKKIGQIHKPSIGQWEFRVNSSLIKSFQINLITPIHFQHSFKILNTDSHHPGLYSINTEPIQGNDLYSSIRVIQNISQKIIFDRLEFIDLSNNLLKEYKLIKHNELFYTTKIQIPFEDFYIKIKGKTNENEYIERLYSHKITPQIFDIIVNSSSLYLKPEEQTQINFTLINHYQHNLTIDVMIIQSNPIFEIILNKNRFLLKSNEIQSNYFQLKPLNNLTSSSQISIIAKGSDVFNTYSLHANIIPSNTLEPLICNSLFPSGKTPDEMCKGSIDSCSSRYWNIHLNITDRNPTNIRVGIHSIVLTYSDTEQIYSKDSIQYIPNESNRFNLQLFLSPNNCCKKYVDIVVYDQNGHKTNCNNFRLF